MLKKYLPSFKKELEKNAAIPSLNKQIINPGMKAASNAFMPKRQGSPIVNRISHNMPGVR